MNPTVRMACVNGMERNQICSTKKNGSIWKVPNTIVKNMKVSRSRDSGRL